MLILVFLSRSGFLMAGGMHSRLISVSAFHFNLDPGSAMQKMDPDPKPKRDPDPGHKHFLRIYCFFYR